MISVKRVLGMTLVIFHAFASAGIFAEEHAYPAFSPDGKWLAFSSDRNGNHDLFVAGSDGNGLSSLYARSGTQTQPTWSPDGKEIAFIHRSWNPGSQSALMVVAADGSSPKRVGELRDVAFPFWAPDGRIYFSMRVMDQADIFSVPPAGGDLVNHTNTPALDEGNVHVIAERMAYDVPSGDDYVIEIRSTQDDTTSIFLGNAIHWDPHWLSNGNLLIGVYPYAGATLSRLVEFDPQGGEVKRWTPDGYNVFWPAVAPNERSVVFSYTDKDFGVGTLHVLDFSSGAIRPFLIKEGN